MIAPKSANPTTKPTRLVTVNTRFSNSVSGRIGSAARRSTNAKATSDATPITTRAMLWADSQAQVVPPRLVKSTIAESPAARSAAPR